MFQCKCRGTARLQWFGWGTGAGNADAQLNSLADGLGDLVVEREHPEAEHELVLALEVHPGAEHRLQCVHAVCAQERPPVLVYPQHQLQAPRYSRQVLVVL